MKILKIFLALLLCCYLSESQANRVYVHPFELFAGDNVSCQTLQGHTAVPLQTLPVTPLDIDIPTPDERGLPNLDAQQQNITQRMVVLAQLLNFVGLRMYQALNSAQQSTNILFSPVTTYGSLVNFYLGASRRTASSFQLLLGLSSGTDPEKCVSLVDGHKVLQTLKSIISLVDDGKNDEITTQVWAFTRQDAQISEEFIQGMQDFSDTSFTRGVDFSKPQEAEQLVNSFMEKTSDGKVKSIFKDLNSSTDFLFVTAFNFQGNWQTAFKPEKTSLQEFHVDKTTTVMVPLMTRTGQYHYLNDKVRQCTVVKLSLSKQSYMLLVLPHEGVALHETESRLAIDVMSHWQQNLQKGQLELSLPMFSMSSATDLRELLTTVNAEIEVELLGSQAEFSQLSNISPFTVDKAVNKVTFTMSEEGPEFQGRTEEAGIPLKLSINRPFFFSIIEEDSDAILMLGRIKNPTI